MKFKISHENNNWEIGIGVTSDVIELVSAALSSLQIRKIQPFDLIINDDVYFKSDRCFYKSLRDMELCIDDLVEIQFSNLKICLIYQGIVEGLSGDIFNYPKVFDEDLGYNEIFRMRYWDNKFGYQNFFLNCEYTNL